MCLPLIDDCTNNGWGCIIWQLNAIYTQTAISPFLSSKLASPVQNLITFWTVLAVLYSGVDDENDNIKKRGKMEDKREPNQVLTIAWPLCVTTVTLLHILVVFLSREQRNLLHWLFNIITCQPVRIIRFQQAKTSYLSKVYQVLAKSTVEWTMSYSAQPTRIVEVFISSAVHSLIGCHAQTHDLKWLMNITNLSNTLISFKALIRKSNTT